jgi:hypothetical protein
MLIVWIRLYIPVQMQHAMDQQQRYPVLESSAEVLRACLSARAKAPSGHVYQRTADSRVLRVVELTALQSVRHF